MVEEVALPLAEDCQSIANEIKEPDSKSHLDDASKQPLAFVKSESSDRLPDVEEKYYESKVTQVHLSRSEHLPIPDKDEKSLPVNVAACHEISEIEEATCNLSSVDNNQVPSGSVDIKIASVTSPKKSAASAKKISIGAMCKELTHKLVAEVVLEETTEVITKQASSLLSSGKDGDVGIKDGEDNVEIITSEKATEKKPADDLIQEQTSSSSENVASSQDKLSDEPLQPIATQHERSANEPMQAIVFENCVKGHFASVPESLPIQDLLSSPSNGSDVATVPSQEELSVPQASNAVIATPPQEEIKVEPLDGDGKNEKSDVHGSNESLSATGAAASPEEKPSCPVAKDEQKNMKEEQCVSVCDGEIYTENPVKTVYLSGTDITLNPSSTAPEAKPDSSEDKNGEEGKYRSSWYSNKSNDKTVSRANRMYINRAKVGTLRYLILQSPLVMCDVDISDDEESDVEFDENGEVIQDYPLGYLPTYIVEQIFSHLSTRDLAALKCTCKEFKWLIERYNIIGIDSRWLESAGYRDDPCFQCGKIRDARGDVSLCRWHPKIYYKNGHIGRRYWTCCFALDEDAMGCQVGVHDNNWVLSGFKIRKVPRPWRSMYWRSFSVSEMWW